MVCAFPCEILRGIDKGKKYISRRNIIHIWLIGAFRTISGSILLDPASTNNARHVLIRILALEMSFANLKAARQAKQSYVTSNALEISQESSAVPSQVVDQSPEQTSTEKIYKSIPEYLETRTSSTSGRGLWTTKSCSPGWLSLLEVYQDSHDSKGKFFWR
jgi:hypothetical protein